MRCLPRQIERVLKVHYTGLNYIVFDCNQSEALGKLTELVRQYHVIDESINRLLEDVKKREKLGSTEIYPKVIMPHINEKYVNQTTVIIVRFDRDTNFLGHPTIRAAVLVLTNGANDALAEFMHALADPQVFEYILDLSHSNDDVKDYFIKGGEN